MTRRVWETNDGWQVATGYDRMLGRFFLDISKECDACAAQGAMDENSSECETCGGRGTIYLFNNLDSTDMTLVDHMGDMTYEQVELALKRYLTEYPESVMTILYADQDANVGNHEHNFGTIGAVKI